MFLTCILYFVLEFEFEFIYLTYLGINLNV